MCMCPWRREPVGLTPKTRSYVVLKPPCVLCSNLTRANQIEIFSLDLSEDHLNVFPPIPAVSLHPQPPTPLYFIVFVFLFMSPIFPFDHSGKCIVVLQQKV